MILYMENLWLCSIKAFNLNVSFHYCFFKSTIIIFFNTYKKKKGFVFHSLFVLKYFIRNTAAQWNKWMDEKKLIREHEKIEGVWYNGSWQIYLYYSLFFSFLGCSINDSDLFFGTGGDRSCFSLGPYQYFRNLFLDDTSLDIDGKLNEFSIRFSA